MASMVTLLGVKDKAILGSGNSEGTPGHFEAFATSWLYAKVEPSGCKQSLCRNLQGKCLGDYPRKLAGSGR